MAFKYCGYQWQPLTDNPARCPKCKTRRYLGGNYKECKQCGHKWFATTRITTRCPSCDSTKWNQDKAEEVLLTVL